MALSRLNLGQIEVAREKSVYFCEQKSTLFFCAADKTTNKGVLLHISSLNGSSTMLDKFLTQVRNEKIQLSSSTIKVLAPQALKESLDKELQSRNILDYKFVPSDHLGPEIYFYAEGARLRVSETAPASPVISPKSVSKIRVLIVDDSTTIHQLLSKIFEQSPEIEVVGMVADPFKVETAVRDLKPDVMTVDIHMPGMDGVTLLKTLLPKYPIPAVLVSSISMEEGSHVLNGLEAGAVDHIQKPTFEGIVKFAPEIIEKIKVASTIKVKTAATRSIIPSHRSLSPLNMSYIVAIGASTGGTEALKVVLSQLPPQVPPILIVQHIPPVFSTAFAKRLNEICPFEVKEAQDGDEVQPGKVYVAPGGLQMSVVRKGLQLKVCVQDTEPVNRHKPSVDVLFNSLAVHGGKKMVGVILTGMGGDGAKGLLKLRQAGAKTFAQDEATSCVYGMPRVAAELGAVEKVLPLDQIAGGVLDVLQKPVMKKSS